MDMHVQVLSGHSPTQNVMLEVPRRSANYHPTVWGDYFLTHPSGNMETDISMEDPSIIQQLKKEVREMLVVIADNPSEQLKLIDDIQRLGVSYQFESEIDAALQHIHDKYHEGDCTDDLYTVSLHFRLLRQQGYNVTSDVFKKFKDKEGKFMVSLMNKRGILSFYEATHFRVHGEDILEEALAFTTAQLESMITQVSSAFAAQVIHALKQPIHKGLTRLEAKHYISIYHEESHNKALLRFAKLDFNLLQKVHQTEVSLITRWWKDLNFAKKLPFARDRVVECYFWILGVYFDPQHAFARMLMTKIMAMTSIIDDICDVYGTLEELILFTDAIERWDISALDQLPEYMKLCYQSLLDVYSDIDEAIAMEGKSYRVHYAKAAMKQLVRVYFDEAKWFHEGCIPTMEEYMQVALVSCGYIMLATTSFVGMGDLVTKESFDWVSNEPLILRASSIICRLMDDMVEHKTQQETGHVVSAVECYMKQHGTSKEEVYAEFHKQVTNAWKDVNQECLCPTAVPMPLLTRVVNLARVVNQLFKNEDGYTNSKGLLKELITFVIIDPVPI